MADTRQTRDAGNPSAAGAIRSIYERAAAAEARERGPIATHSAAARATYEACLRDLAKLNAPNPRVEPLGRAHPGVSLLAAYWAHYASSTGLPPSWPDLMLLDPDDLHTHRVARLEAAGVAVPADEARRARIGAHIAWLHARDVEAGTLREDGYSDTTREALDRLGEALRTAAAALRTELA